MSARTPGPWFAEPSDCPSAWLVVAGKRGISAELVAPNVSEANARLIAAAPRMLNLARMVINEALRSSLLHEARAILREVEGESHG